MVAGLRRLSRGWLMSRQNVVSDAVVLLAEGLLLENASPVAKILVRPLQLPGLVLDLTVLRPERVLCVSEMASEDRVGSGVWAGSKMARTREATKPRVQNGLVRMFFYALAVAR